MTINDDDHKDIKKHGEGEGEGESGQGGKATGSIQFTFKDERLGSQRDDLSPEEEKRLLAVLKDTHKERVDKQKRTRKERADIKNGRISLNASHRGMVARGGGGGQSRFKKHPISDKFAGRDPQVSPLTDKYTGETNPANQEQLEYQHQLRHRHTMQFNPRPSRPRT